jgi:hypothetical protein
VIGDESKKDEIDESEKSEKSERGIEISGNN